MEYSDFIASKQLSVKPSGFNATGDLNPKLKDFQRDICRWGLRLGRAGIYTDCVAGETVIHGPDGSERIDVLCSRGKPIRVWSLNENGHVEPAIATCPFLKGFDSLYRVTLKSGRTIIGTSGHFVLTLGGWLSISQLESGVFVAVSELPQELTSFRPRSISELSHPEQLGGNIRTFQQSREDCSPFWPSCELHPSEEKQFSVVPSGVSFDPVVSVQYIRDDYFYDLHVPYFENYLSDEIWSHNTGLGKSLKAITIAEQVVAHTGGQFLILCPLAVGRQFVLEAKKFGCQANLNICSSQDSVRPGITITNYEKLHKFDMREFVGIGLDEASILASLDGKYRNDLIDRCQVIPYRYCFTATPSPNDIMEIGSYAEFLGVMKRSEMLATFFVHDGGDTSKWRLKRHAEKEFYRWMAGFSVMLRRPSGLGYSDEGYILPELKIHEHVIETKTPKGWLFTTDAKTLHDQRAARRDTIAERTALMADMANRDPNEPWVVWTGLNDESTAASRAIHNSIEITGSQPDWQKEQNLIDFIEQNKVKLVTKTKIAGFGLNLQFCNQMGFLGLSHSYISFYQAIRRIWRFGQVKPCNVHVVVSDRDGAVLESIHRKQVQHEAMIDGMADAIGEWTRQEILGGGAKRKDYEPKEEMRIPEWLQQQTA